MDKNKSMKEELARKIQQCLSEAGVKAELDLSEHEAVVHARLQVEGQEDLRVIAFLSDREVKPEGYGPVVAEVVRPRLVTAVVKPTLASQTAAGAVRQRYNPPGEEKQES